ncbi:hypothetical protein PVM11_09620 [Enterobacter roggenkampii]|uniref:hypothetical protein n=1 Tax=Enterobacter roggenkampii TaxID=1812935 RepID=UPI0011BD4A18|nr:hypothetical protein [Enterobacter roggenkampii]MCE1987097.1 hypothetical protein [Enterobacter roggenkampii]MCK6706525.1 hypothetical protein [Enterobacter roggenkampii]MCK6909253.1 hypothetical protein [Enterobacter roggenkampii]MCK7202526.1 hypothetical protein [Enterobacter roggenkampii]MDD9239154.1 hypothetical protein [Enterobacter roggenkampii]
MSVKFKYLICTLLFAAGALVSFFYTIHKKNALNNNTCSTKAILYHNEIRANISLDYMYTLKNKTGIVTVSGTYYKSNKYLGSIRQDVSYTWTENKNNFNFVSTRIDKIITSNPVTDKELSYVLPDFYIYPGKQIAFTIVNQGPKGYIFTIGKRPLFLCTIISHK